MKRKSRDLKGAFFRFLYLIFLSFSLSPILRKSPRLLALRWKNIRSWLLPQAGWIKEILPKLSFYQPETGPGNVCPLPIPPAMENSPWKGETLSRGLPLEILLLPAGQAGKPSQELSDITAFHKHTWNSISWVTIGSFLLLFISSRYTLKSSTINSGSLEILYVSQTPRQHKTVSHIKWGYPYFLKRLVVLIAHTTPSTDVSGRKPSLRATDNFSECIKLTCIYHCWHNTSSMHEPFWALDSWVQRGRDWARNPKTQVLAWAEPPPSGVAWEPLHQSEPWDSHLV